jgi:hypothetical protein
VDPVTAISIGAKLFSLGMSATKPIVFGVEPLVSNVRPEWTSILNKYLQWVRTIPAELKPFIVQHAKIHPALYMITIPPDGFSNLDQEHYIKTSAYFSVVAAAMVDFHSTYPTVWPYEPPDVAWNGLSYSSVKTELDHGATIDQVLDRPAVDQVELNASLSKAIVEPEYIPPVELPTEKTGTGTADLIASGGAVASLMFAGPLLALGVLAAYVGGKKLLKK